MKKLFLIILTLFPIWTMAQQQPEKNRSYMRFEGNIGDGISITANLVQLFGKMSGNYQYRFLEEDHESMYFGKTVELSGEIDEDGNIGLKEFGRSGYAFQGVLKGNQFTGNWYADEDRLIPFEMTEYYPNGSMGFEVHYLNSGRQLVSGNPESPSAEIEVTLIYPANDYITPEVTEFVQQAVMNSFFGEGFEAAEPEEMLINFRDEYFTEYIKQNKDWHEIGGASFNWEKVISMSVIYNSNYILCLEYLKYAYSGGAHGMTNISYDIIYLDDGQLLTFADIFREDSNEMLSEVLTTQLRKDYSIPANVSLLEAGFFVEAVEPNHNIYVNGNGIGFLYNSYEIAPYAQGSTNIFLEWKQIKGMVRQGTPVYTMSQR